VIPNPQVLFRLSTNSTLAVSDSDPSFTSKSRGQGINTKRGAYYRDQSQDTDETWIYAVLDYVQSCSPYVNSVASG
jgi:hypothetical protein